jgi:archaeosortase B (VPXXXP-CTERM-specific)
MESRNESEKNIAMKFSFKVNMLLLRFLAIFGFLLGVLYVLTIQFEPYVPIFNIATTSATLVELLKLFGLQASLNSNGVSISNFVFDIVRQCTGLFEVITLIAAIFAYPSSLKNKMKGIAIGLPLIYIFNIVRLVSLAYVGIYSFSLLEIVHDYILQITFFSFVVSIWFYWINNVVRKNVEEAK